MVETSDLQQVWFIVSPQNPLKSAKSLAHEFDRYDMVQAAINDGYNLRASDIEFNMPRPSYTVDTLAYLADRHPEHEFKLILDNYGLYVYPRPADSRHELADQSNVQWVEAPILDISATYIRNLVKQDKSIQYLVPDSVAQIIKSRKLYI